MIVADPSAALCNMVSVCIGRISTGYMAEISADHASHTLDSFEVFVFGISQNSLSISEKIHHCAQNAARVSRLTFNESTYELRRDLRDDGISVGAQSSHSSGYPMSQRLNAGFNAPRFPVCTWNPPCTRPVFAKRGLFLSPPS